MTLRLVRRYSSVETLETNKVSPSKLPLFEKVLVERTPAGRLCPDRSYLPVCRPGKGEISPLSTCCLAPVYWTQI